MNLKLIALDLDGTLLNSSHQIPSKTKEIIRQIQDQGIGFTLASGRPFLSTLPYAEELELKLPIITTNGALIRNPETRDTLFQRNLPLAIAQEIINDGFLQNLSISLYYEEEILTFNQESILRHFSLEKITATLATDHIIAQPPLKIIYCAHPTLISKAYQRAQQKFGEQVYITQSEDIYLEFMNKKVSKGGALEVIIENMNISPEEILVMGNNYNDLTMFKLAKWSVAMANSPQKVLDRADYVTKTNDEEGVRYFLEIFLQNGLIDTEER